MKKAIVIMLTSAMMLAAVACGGGSNSNSTPAAETQTEEAKPAEETAEAVESTVQETEEAEANIAEEAISYEDYLAAATDSEVVIQGAIQGKQSYYAQDDAGTANIYLQDQNGGAYFLYQLPCGRYAEIYIFRTDAAARKIQRVSQEAADNARDNRVT